MARPTSRRLPRPRLRTVPPTRPRRAQPTPNDSAHHSPGLAAPGPFNLARQLALALTLALALSLLAAPAAGSPADATTPASAPAPASPGPIPGERPSILWLTAEDLSPHLGCYGDTYADTPHLDRLAARSLRYRQAWSSAPVCAPARTTLILGRHATSVGGHHMRSAVRLPPGLQPYPQVLRNAGYYCVNNAKEDYNLTGLGRIWDESSKRAHWTNRAPGQPFFAVFNFEITHESRLRTRPHTLVHDPAKAPLPPYHPDTPEVRHDWAQSYDNITTLDGQVAARLRELEQSGLAEHTIVFFFGDHGSGMPRSKRWPYASGLRVPLLVHVPDRWRHLAPPDYLPGATTDRLVHFADFGPTLCSLVGVRPPASMQGEPFLGRFATRQPARRFSPGYRGRMDERNDVVRSLTDGRYLYVRNYLPHLIYGQHLAYMFETPTTRVWQRLYQEGRLQPPQTFFWEPKPPEELYDLESDPHEIRNLAGSPAHARLLETLRKAQRKQVLDLRDLGFMPESEMHRLSDLAGLTPAEFGASARRYPLDRILEMAELASRISPTPPRDGDAGPSDPHLPKLRRALSDRASSVRWWAAQGLLMRGSNAVQRCLPELEQRLDDESPAVRIAAATALGRFAPHPTTPTAGAPATNLSARSIALLAQLADTASVTNQAGYWAALEALQGLDLVGARARPWLTNATFAALKGGAPVEKKLQEYVPRLLDALRPEGPRASSRTPASNPRSPAQRDPTQRHPSAPGRTEPNPIP